MTGFKCRACDAILKHSFCNLGASPLSNAFLSEAALDEMEPAYPLHARVCEACLLVQLPEYRKPSEIFHEYPYFSSYSKTWLRHARKYATKVIKRFKLTVHSRVVEIASNDGYLLQHFKEKQIPVFGIEPAKNVAQVAIDKGISTHVGFFGVETAQKLVEEGQSADLLIGNNVLAHVPDVHDFVAGLKMLLKPHGRITLEFPHLLQLIEKNQFDTIYHEHFSYFSLYAVEKIFIKHGLKVYDVEELDTHGGSLRLYIRHENDESGPAREGLVGLRKKEQMAGLDRLKSYLQFSEKVEEARLCFLSFLVALRYDGRTVAAYGAPAKGNTLLNTCGIRPDLLPFTVDKNPHKQGRFLPGSRIPIFHPDKIKEIKPDYLVILPWNLKSEVMDQMAFIREWHGRFVVPIPKVEVFS